MTDQITFTLDGQEVTAEKGVTIWGGREWAWPCHPASVSQTGAGLSP